MKNVLLCLTYVLGLFALGCGHAATLKNPLALGSSWGTSGDYKVKKEVLVLRGQSPELCARPGQARELYYFVILRGYPPSELWVHDKSGTKIRLFGRHFTIKVKATLQPGFMSWVTTNFTFNNQEYDVTSILIPCEGAFVAWSWNSGATASISADTVDGSLDAQKGSEDGR